MLISDAIEMLKESMSKHGDVELYVHDGDYEREVERDADLLCECPLFEAATSGMPERIVI